jgi:hypothetical protein
LDTKTDAYIENNGINDKKAEHIKWSFIFFVVGIILLLLYAIIFLLVHEKFLTPNSMPNHGMNGSVSTLDNDSLRQLILGESYNQ